MTNINCLANCIYQKDGKCSYENICAKTLSFGSDCAYFTKQKDNKENHSHMSNLT